MTPTEYAQKQTDYWRGVHDNRRNLDRFKDAPPIIAPLPELPRNPYTGPFIEDPYEKYYDK